MGFWIIKALATCTNWVLSVCDIHLPPCGAGIGSHPSFPDLIRDIPTSLLSFSHPCHPPGCSTSPPLFHPSTSSSFSLSHSHSLHLQEPPECPFSREWPFLWVPPPVILPQAPQHLVGDIPGCSGTNIPSFPHRSFTPYLFLLCPQPPEEVSVSPWLGTS